MKLVITEKPSVAQSIAKVIGANNRKGDYLEGSGYIVSWNYGHLFELKSADEYDPKFKNWEISTLPIIPERFLSKIRNDKTIRNHFKVLKELLNSNNVSEVINAGDAGREGELIFRETYYMSGSKKPVKRLWLSSMEEKAIKDGFNHLKDGKEYNSLYYSAKARQEADWLVGINGTRLFTIVNNQKRVQKVGRVQSPTLAMIVKREGEIKNFKVEDYYKAVAVIDYNNCHFYAYSSRIDDKAIASVIVDKLNSGIPLIVNDVKKEERKINVPHLYDLTSLQKDASKYFGLTADQTLTSAQNLYEKKLTTYPRTDSQYLSDEMGKTALDVLKAVETVFTSFHNGAKTIKPNIDKHLNSNKVSDHHAIIPTLEILKGIPKDLEDNDKKILMLIAERMIEAFNEPHIYEATEIDFTFNQFVFISKGKVIKNNGWKEKLEEFRAFVKADEDEPRNKNKDNEDQSLPVITVGKLIKASKALLKACKTTPPSRFNEASILTAMENAGANETSKDAERKGLGTPATRAEVLKKLVSDGYVKREKKTLIPTEEGVKLITSLPEKIKSASLTAEWENTLAEIARGKADYNAFMDNIKNEVIELVSSYKGKVNQLPKERRLDYGLCPKCGKPLYKSKFNNGTWCPNCSKKAKELKHE